MRIKYHKGNQRFTDVDIENYALMCLFVQIVKKTQGSTRGTAPTYRKCAIFLIIGCHVLHCVFVTDRSFQHAQTHTALSGHNQFSLGMKLDLDLFNR